MTHKWWPILKKDDCWTCDVNLSRSLSKASHLLQAVHGVDPPEASQPMPAEALDSARCRAVQLHMLSVS